MLDVKIVNSFFIFSKNIDQTIICVIFGIMSFLVVKNKLRYVLPLLIVGTYFLSTLGHYFMPLDGISILSFPVVMLLIIFGNAKVMRFASGDGILSLYSNYFFLVLILFCIYSLCVSSLKIFGIIGLDSFPRDYAFDIFVLISRPTPYLVIMLSLSLFIRVLHSFFEK